MNSDFHHTSPNADFYDDCDNKSKSLIGIEVIDNILERRKNDASKWNQRVLSSPENPFSYCDTVSVISVVKPAEEDLFR